MTFRARAGWVVLPSRDRALDLRYAAARRPTLRDMNGLYALKPWYAERLATPRAWLLRRSVPASAVSWTGVGCGGCAGAVLASMRPGVGAGLAVGVLLALRLACANLDGGLARASGTTTRWGGVVNELSDRLADLAMLAGLATQASAALVLAAGLGATLPSSVALAGAAHGAPRRQGGPVGKTERCALVVVAAFIGHAEVIAAVIAIGGVVTALARAGAVRRTLAGAA
jgi:CDP-diacylglycerol---glycerol-3-phosphate 3-phosphatidyltransferase